MERLAGAHEHLDGELDAAVLAGNLRDLARINRWLGGVELSRRAIGALAIGPRRDSRTTLTVLDVGAGGADIPAALLTGRRGNRMTITATDARPEIVAQAHAMHGGIPGLAHQVADGTQLPWPNEAFDVAHISLVLHHLEPEAAEAMLAELGRVARLGVVVNDLDRSRHGWLGAWLLLHATTRNPYTRHDGPLSVRRAYRPGEVAALAGRLGLLEIGRFNGILRHRYAIAFARSPEVAV
ncbi:hypothetical protein BH24CHL9_BH24CHL9_15990 [soil metagenome]